jgi:hypothetical protein
MENNNNFRGGGMVYLISRERGIGYGMSKSEKVNKVRKEIE